MKTSTLILKSALLFLLLTAFKCDDQASMDCEDYVSKLDGMSVKIQDMAEASVCNENFECQSIAFGSKPCGGPWSYVVYSTSIDTLELRKLVTAYNKTEQEYNQACQQYSDCMMVSPPVRLECENNTCIAIY